MCLWDAFGLLSSSFARLPHNPQVYFFPFSSGLCQLGRICLAWPVLTDCSGLLCISLASPWLKSMRSPERPEARVTLVSSDTAQFEIHSLSVNSLKLGYPASDTERSFHTQTAARARACVCVCVCSCLCALLWVRKCACSCHVHTCECPVSAIAVPSLYVFGFVLPFCCLKLNVSA